MKTLTRNETKQTIENIDFLFTRVEEMLFYLKEYLNGADVVEKIVALEREINNNQIKFDQENLATALNGRLDDQSIRLILSAIRIFSDLERLADRVVEVIGLYKEMHEPDKFKDDIMKLVELNLEMFAQMSAAYKNVDKETALKAVKFDDNINALKDQYFSRIVDSMLHDRVDSDDGIRCSMIISSLERLGDRIENVAEDIYYIITGDDIRYSDN